MQAHGRIDREEREPMNESKHGHHGHGIPDGEHTLQDSRPYWQRAHRDWRFWAVMILFVAAISIYVVSDDLAIHLAVH
jgi:hypothetical protein